MTWRAALICLVWLGSSPAAAYVRGRADSGAPLQWMRTSCVPLRVNAAGSDDVTDGSDLDAVRRAAEGWRQATAHCSFIEWVLLEPSATALPHYDSHGANENVIYWVERDWPFPAEWVANTVVWKTTTGEILDADVLLNGQHHTFSTTGAPGTRDIESTIAHELGHVLGLDHTCDVDAADHEGQPVVPCAEAPAAAREALMYPKSAAGQTRSAPQPDDVLGVCQVYPLELDPERCAATPAGCACELERPGATTPLGILLFLLLGLTARAAASYGRGT